MCVQMWLCIGAQYNVGVHVCVCMFVYAYVCPCMCVCMNVHAHVCLCVCALLISHDRGLETWLLKGGLTTLPTTPASPTLASLSCGAGGFVPDQPPQPLMEPWGHGRRPEWH